MLSSVTDHFKKRICKYLIQRYLGQYLQEKLTLDQLNIDISNGRGNVLNVSLDCEALNALAEQAAIPIEFVSGHLDCISLAIPWKSLTTESCEIEVSGLEMRVRPKKRVNNSSMFDSMLSGMASSMQLAAECLNLKSSESEEDERESEETSSPISGLEQCALAIDAVFSRGKIKFHDTIIRVERNQKGSNFGMAIELRIKLWSYADEIANEPRDTSYSTAFSDKKIILEGLSCYSDIFKVQTDWEEKSSDEGSDESFKEADTTVLFAKFSGRHTCKIRIKEDETIAGPQVSIDLSFGSFISFLSPIQAHIFYTLLDELMNPEQTQNEIWERGVREKPMDTFDFKRVEEELQEQIKPSRIGLSTGLQRQQDESDDEFLPFKTKSGMFSSVHSTLMNNSTTSFSSSVNESVDESIFSATTSRTSHATYATQYSGGLMISEKKFSITLGSAIAVLLHDDILNLSLHSAVESSTVELFQETANKFFNSFGIFTLGAGKKNIEDISEKLNKSCSLNHLRIIMAPLKLSGTVTLTESIPTTVGHLSLGHFSIHECLVEQYSSPKFPISGPIEILGFCDDESYANSVESIRLDFRHKVYRSRNSQSSKTKLKFSLQKCRAEIDISLIDRINSLINSKLHFYANSDSSGIELKQNFLPPKSNFVIFIKVESPSISVNYRFPKPDLRASNDFEKTHYWIRNVQNDSVILKIKGLKLSTVLNSTVDIFELDTIGEELLLYFKETESSEPLLFGEATPSCEQEEGHSMNERGFDWPRAVVWIYPQNSEISPAYSSHNSEEYDPMLMEAFVPQKLKEPSPFSSKRVFHERNNASEDSNDYDDEEVTPGDRAEMLNFIEYSSKNVIYKIELNLRYVSLSLPSKEFFEKIYNRLSSDLLLWEPSGPKDVQIPPSSRLFHEFKNEEKGSEEEEEEELSAFYIPNQNTNSYKNKTKNRTKGQSELALSLSIRKGNLSFYTPFINVSGAIDPTQRGQVSFSVEEGNFFLVSGFKGDLNLGYICFYAQQAEFYHSDLVVDGPLVPKLTPSTLRKTVYQSGSNLNRRASGESLSSDSYEMVSGSIKIERDPIKNIKSFKVATGVKGGILNHVVSLPNRSWLAQLIEFFDVVEEAVPGYAPAAVLTQLYLTLWNCSIDYAPLNLELRSILTIENFVLSSNIVASTNMSVIRILAEESAFYLSTCKNSIDLRNEYVCVLDMDLFELSLRLSQSRTTTNNCPKIELSCSNNTLNIRTCSDSFKLLTQLLTYFANDGDLQLVDNGTQTEEKQVGDAALIDVVESIRGVTSRTELDNLHELVKDAMDEDEETSPQSTPNRKTGKGRGVELHFERDDDESRDEFESEERYDNNYNHEPIMETSSHLPIDINVSDEDEEEFCILENDPGVGILNSNGEPTARVLTTEPIKLIENHFSVPLGRTDILKPPKHYPKATMRYGLHDIGIIWYLYGGEDFPTPSSSSNRGSTKTLDRSSSETIWSSESVKSQNYHPLYDQGDVDIGLDALGSNVVFSKTKEFENAREAFESPAPVKKQSIDLKHWRNKGGRSRRQDTCIELHLTKIKFQHEVYPEDTEQASRQVLVINMIEIHDRLSSSNYNKMLYLFSSSSKPRQSHANMVVCKMCHLRPDPQLSIEECCLKISLLPIRLNVDQDALLFLYQFFTQVAPKGERYAFADDERAKPPSHTPSLESLPVMTVKNLNEEESKDDEIINEGNLFEESPTQEDNISTSSKDPSIDSSRSLATPIYFRQVIFSPDVPIRIDYAGKRLDMTHGPLAGILMCLGQLNNSEIRLKALNYRNGILGFDKLIIYMLNEWGVDIKKNQLPSLLGGIGPLYSFVQIFQGVRDLFWLPIEQYQKDGRLTKGFQRGASSFSTSAAMAALELTNRLVQTIQSAAEFTYDMVSPGPSVQQQRRLSTRKKRLTQPNDIKDGVTNAYHVLREGFGDTAKNIVRVASREHEQKGLSGAVGGVLRQIAPTVCVPIILSSQAASSVLDGFKSQLEPESKKDAAEKWKEF